MKMARDDDYKFLQIVDAMASINQKVNLIGVVLETSIPKRTKGTDCFCTLKIVDESRSSPGISVNFFAETMEKLPCVGLAGDIIQLSCVVAYLVQLLRLGSTPWQCPSIEVATTENSKFTTPNEWYLLNDTYEVLYRHSSVKMKTHGSEVYALFNKKFSSFALFEGKHGTHFVPYQVSPIFHATREQDKKFIVGLRKWLVDYKLDTGPKDSSSLKEIREGEHYNLVCKVLHICGATKDEWMLFVWDGTDTPPVTVQAKLGDEMENPLPLHLEQFSLSRDVLSMFPAVGTILRVIVDLSKEKLGLHLLKTGRWVKFINMKCEVYAGFWRGMLMPFTKLRYLPDDDDLVLQSQRTYDERVRSKWRRMPLVCFPWPSHVTELDYPHVPFVTLMNVLTYPEVTAKFRCVVRAVAAFPWRAEDFRSPLGTYRIRLTLEDPTARIHAFLYAEDGVEFFGGYPSIEVMIKKRNTLLGISESYDDGKKYEDAPRNPPWVQCCLKSYYLNKSDIWGSRCYRIFATRMVG